MWNEGYVSEIDYVHGYFAETSPVRLRLALLARGLLAPTRPAPAYLELGFGQGLSLAINAVTSAGRFYGTDFNPAQAASASELIGASGREVAIFEDGFERFAERDDLPQFDIIVLHGIWSWVSDAARAAIVRIAAEKLAPGGIFYVSYNAMPGWAPTLALRQLLSQYGARVARGGLLAQVDQSLGFVEQLIATDAGYFAANPGVAQRLQQIKAQDRTYVSHEYFNRNWHPMSFIEVADQLYEAKLSFAASANVIDSIPHLAVPARGQALIAGIDDPAFREMTRDYLINQHFRRDIFVKGLRPLAPAEHLERAREQLFLLTGDPQNPPVSVASGAGSADLRPEIYQPIVAAIGERDDRPFTIVDIGAADPEIGGHWQIWEALLILTATGFVSPVEPSGADPAVTQATAALNREVCRRARYADKIQYLAAARIGCGVPVSRIEQLFLAAEDGVEDRLSFVEDVLARQGDQLLVDGAPVTDRLQARALLSTILEEFERTKRPLLRRVGAMA